MTQIAQNAPEIADTRERLLLTALRLYAREGLHAVSLRRISTEAGSKNSAAMHYHFQNKLGVVQALVEMIARELGRIAKTLRSEHNSPRTLRSACRDNLQPLVQLPARKSWGGDGVHFLSRLVSENDADIATMMNAMFAPFWQRLDAALEQQLPELPAPIRRLRLMFMSTNVFHGVAEVAWLTHTPLGDLSHFDEDTLLDHLVDYLIGGLQAPSLSLQTHDTREHTMTETAEDLLFDLTLTDEQRMNRESMQRFAAAEIRAQAKPVDEGASPARDFYPKTAELGLTLLPIPEALGGAGVDRSPVSNALIFEDLAHGDMSLALGAVVPMAFVNTLLDQGSDAQREKYLPEFCSGEFKAATTALLEPRATFEPTAPATTATSNSDGYILTGTKSMVPLGLDAELILVIAALDNASPAAFIVEGTPQGMSRTEEANMGLLGAQLATLTFDQVQLPASALLGDGDFNLQRFLDLSRLGICALAVGTCQAVLDYVIPYCNERVAFGEPITNRQSVAFMIADIAIELEAMCLMTWRAAARAEHGMDFHEHAYLAKAFCAKHAMKIGTDGVQLLGGHGFCREHPVEMWYRNLRAIATLEGVASI